MKKAKLSSQRLIGNAIGKLKGRKRHASVRIRKRVPKNNGRVAMTTYSFEKNKVKQKVIEKTKKKATYDLISLFFSSEPSHKI